MTARSSPERRAPLFGRRHGAVALLAVCAGALAAQAQAPPDDPCFRHDAARGECSPGASAPTPSGLARVVVSGLDAAMETALEHGELVECASCGPPLEVALTAEDDERRDVAAWWLGRRALWAGGPLSRARTVLASDPDAARRSRAAVALGAMGHDAMAPALAAAAGGDADASVRAAAVSALVRLSHPEAVAVVTAAVGDPDADVRRAAVASVDAWRVGPDPAGLIVLLDDPEPDLRRRAARLLGVLGVTAAVPVLASAALADPEWSVRQAAVFALGRLRGDAADAALVQVATRETHPRVLDALP